MAAYPVLTSPGHIQLELLQQKREENGAEMRLWGKYGTLGAMRDILKPQPVHSTAQSVVVGQLFDGPWWREARGGNQEKKNH